jgi:hypothetical protein
LAGREAEWEVDGHESERRGRLDQTGPSRGCWRGQQGQDAVFASWGGEGQPVACRRFRGLQRRNRSRVLRHFGSPRTP